MKSLCFIILLSAFSIFSQNSIYGIVVDETYGEPIPYARVNYISSSDSTFVYSDEFGRFYLSNIPLDSFKLIIHSSYFNDLEINYLEFSDGNLGKIKMASQNQLKAIDIVYENPFETGSLRTIEGVTLTNGKKTQRISIDKLEGNKSTNNAREIYAKVPGLTIWESDGGGLQLGLGTRGLNPSRSGHINTRQNGYDISADPLGYPETYYTPPVQALSSINFIRGAASLQFGPQFGGMVNFIMKKPVAQPFNYQGEHTYGAYNLISTYHSFSGTLKKRFTYFGYGLYKQGDGWRENSEFKQWNAYLKLSYAITEKLFVSVEHTYMSYLAKQAGGLTDALFNANPQQSIRQRNWFSVNWNITAADLYWNISPRTIISWKSYTVNAERQALGNLDKISRIDDLKERDIIAGKFNNWGSEFRILKKYPLGNKATGVLSSGIRYYRGVTSSKQGKGTAGFDADFNFLNPENLEGSNYTFPSQNIAVFAENMFKLSEKFSLSFGGRVEYIATESEGYYREMVYHPLTNELLFDTSIFEAITNIRTIFLGGIGFSYNLMKNEVYGNVSQNYRAINFSDIRIVNPNQKVDPEISDERGFNADLGIRGANKKWNYDFSAFFLYYNNKIGVISTTTPDFETIRLRTNVGLAYSTGLELFLERVFQIGDSSHHDMAVFTTISPIYARYGRQEELAYSQKQIEEAPPISLRIGIKYHVKKWRFGLLGSYVHKHYTDATNAEFDANAIAGIVPSYYVLDFSSSFAAAEWLSIKAGINNLTNNAYFTRRATAYPGPGIIPSDGISAYLTIGLNF